MWLNETQRPCDDDAGGRDWRRVGEVLLVILALLCFLACAETTGNATTREGRPLSGSKEITKRLEHKE